MNNGVYKSGFCTSQRAYERAQSELYSTLDELEGRLSKHRFLVGDKCALLKPSQRDAAAGSPTSRPVHSSALDRAD